MNEFGHLNRQANQQAIDRLLKVRPQLTAVGSAESVLGLKNHTVLHAGPPFLDILQLPKTVQSSIVLSALYEGWASSEQEALTLLQDGHIELKPAQDYRCVTPLAATITPKTTLVCVNDAQSDLLACYSPLSSGVGADIRFGTNSSEVLSTLAFRDTELNALMNAALDTPIDLFHCAVLGLNGGDELHSSTARATQALGQEVLHRLQSCHATSDQIRLIQELMKSNPGFFLTPWMAACKLMLTSIENISNCSFVTRLGGNGENMGLSIAHSPSLWFTQTVSAPRGNRMGHAHPSVEVEGAVGDSCVIDAMGFGGQLTSLSPQVLQSLEEFLPQDYASRSAEIMFTEHNYFASHLNTSDTHVELHRAAKVRCGLDVLKITKQKSNPLVNIAMLASDGINGLLGRGLYELDPLICEKAVRHLLPQA